MTAAVVDADLAIARAAQRARILDRLAPWALIAPALPPAPAPTPAEAAPA